MARARRDVLVRMPAGLKRNLAREVEASEGSLNDIAVGILASRFAVPFEPSGRKGSPPKSRGDVLLRMPAALKEKLQTRAAERGRGTNDLIVEILGERLTPADPSKREERMASRNGTTPR